MNRGIQYNVLAFNEMVLPIELGTNDVSDKWASLLR